MVHKVYNQHASRTHVNAFPTQIQFLFSSPVGNGGSAQSKSFSVFFFLGVLNQGQQHGFFFLFGGRGFLVGTAVVVGVVVAAAVVVVVGGGVVVGCGGGGVVGGGGGATASFLFRCAVVGKQFSVIGFFLHHLESG